MRTDNFTKTQDRFLRFISQETNPYRLTQGLRPISPKDAKMLFKNALIFYGVWPGNRPSSVHFMGEFPHSDIP